MVGRLRPTNRMKDQQKDVKQRGNIPTKNETLGQARRKRGNQEEAELVKGDQGLNVPKKNKSRQLLNTSRQRLENSRNKSR